MFKGGNEWRDIERDPVRRQPVAGHAQGDQYRFGVVVQQPERAIEGSIIPALSHVADDHVRSPAFRLFRQVGKIGKLAALSRLQKGTRAGNRAV